MAFNDQFRSPAGWAGRRLLRNMNRRRSGVTDWGLSHFSIPRDGAILDTFVDFADHGKQAARRIHRYTEGLGLRYGPEADQRFMSIAAPTTACP